MAAQEQEMRRNIEDLNLIQQEIASKEMASQSFVNSINSMQARVDFSLDGIIINVNEFFTNLMHFPREDVFGNHFSMFFYDENLEDFTELWKTMLDTGLNFTHVSQYRARKKSVWLNSTFSILTDSSGLRVGVLMLSSDVSSLKKQEAELFKRQSELDLKILELKDERNLLSSQLIDAGKSVNNLNNEKKQLRDTIADLNHKLLLQNQEVTKVREEEELLKLKNKRVSFNEIENRRKLEEGVKRIQELENKSMQMAHQYKYYESTFELMPYPVVITNTDQEIIFVNTFALILFQKEAIDVVGHHCSIWGSEACKGDSCGIRQLKKGNVNSSVVWNKNSYRLRTYNLTDEQGSLIGFVEIIEDISYINWLESTLENERNLFSEVLDTVPDNVAFKDMGDHFLRINESMASFLNLGTVKEALNMLESDFVGIELINESEAGSILQAQGSLLNKLQRVNLHGGGYKWLMVTKKYLEVSIDGHPGFLEVSSDVTHFMTKIEILQKIENQKNLKIDELQSQLEIVNQDSIEKDQLIKKLQAEINKLKS
jgi:PAS domain S-box-containing protein